MLRELIDDMLMPRLDWLQVEVTTFCNASCLYCPRPAYGNRWRNRHLDPALFKKLLPALRHTDLAYLQGWGEPLLHPDFFDLVSLAKRSGCRVGTTTNGILVDSVMSSRIAASGLDLISFSLAGTGRSNDFWRRGTSLEGVVRAIDSLAEAREKSGSAGPEIHVSYLALRSNLDDLGRLPELLDGMAVSEVIISTLDFIPAAGLGAEAFPPADGDGRTALRAILREVAAKAEKRGLFVHYRLPGDKILGCPCSENPLRSAFLSSDGSVAACVVSGLPADPQDNAPETHPLTGGPKVYGNLAEDSFSAIWRKKAYRAFRRKIEAGRPDPPCAGCLKLSGRSWTKFPYY